VIEYCIDASVAIKWVINDEPFCAEACALLRNAELIGIQLIAPPIFTSEVDSIVRKHVFYSRMSSSEAHKAYSIFDLIPVKIMDSFSIRQLAREIAEKFNQRSVYDSTYAALAELRNCEFWTADKVFYNAVKTTLRYVQYLPDYS
jgi:predicted nucleic acid-binding protein